MQRSNPEVARFYNSPQWKRVRAAYKKYRHNICERCGGIGYIVHHKCYISKANIFNPNVTLNFENLELLCMDCHNKEHFELREFTADGELCEKNNSAMDCVQVYKS